MSIGLIDLDIKYAPIIFNLELMKISAYYKRKGEIVILSPTFNTDKHEKYFARKDYEDGNYPRFLVNSKDDLFYGGLAFTNNIYKPMDIELERIRPDTSIYKNLKSFYIKQSGGSLRKNSQIFDSLMEAEHCRLSLDGKNIWEDYPSQFKFLKSAKNLILHDPNLADIEGSAEEVQKILKKAKQDNSPTKLGMKFPVVCKNSENLLKWCSFNSSGIFYDIEFNGIIEDEAFFEFIGQAREQSLFNQFNYNITSNNCKKGKLTSEDWIRLYKQVIFARSYQIFFNFKYDKDFFEDKRWEQVIDLINYYHNSMRHLNEFYYLNKIPTDTMIDFVQKINKIPEQYIPKNFLTPSELTKIFIFVKKECPELFDAFYKMSFNDIKGEILK